MLSCFNVQNNTYILKYCTLLYSTHRDVDMWGRVWMSRFWGCGRVLTLIKNVFLVLRLYSMHLQGSYLCTISLYHSKEEAKLEIASYDPFKNLQFAGLFCNYFFIFCRGGKSTKIFYSSKSTITLLKFYLSTSKSTSLKIYSSKSKKYLI